MKRQVRYTPSTSKRGRQLRKANGAIPVDCEPGKLTLEQIAWNARVERERGRK